MEHVVFFPGPDGAPAFHRFASLDEAVRFVEHLRNVEGVVDVSVHELNLVPLAFRAYYKVEVPADAAEMSALPEQAVAPEPVLIETEVVPELVADVAADVLEPVPAVAEDSGVPAETADAAAGSNGKRSLGFFAH